jgi:hypothetical protein
MGYVPTLMRIQSAFENAGIGFLDNEPRGGIGVRELFRPSGHVICGRQPMVRNCPMACYGRSLSLSCIIIKRNHLVYFSKSTPR